MWVALLLPGRHDVTFWAERQREAKYSISDEELRPYFALPNVLAGLWQVRVWRAAACHKAVAADTDTASVACARQRSSRDYGSGKPRL
jgi:hypothetical protein